MEDMKFGGQGSLNLALSYLRTGCVGLWRTACAPVGNQGENDVCLDPCLSARPVQRPASHLVFLVLCARGASAVHRHMPGAGDAASLGSALSDPLFFPPGKGGERSTYTAFGRDAGVGGLTQVRLCVGWGLLGPIGTQLSAKPRERDMCDPNFHTGGSLQVGRNWPVVGGDAVEAAVTVPPIPYLPTF